MTITSTTVGKNPLEDMATEEGELEWFYEDLQDLFELTPKKMSFSLEGTGMQKQEVKKHLE